MRKFLYLGFCLVLVMGVGCAVTDYQIITDNDQLIGDQYANATVNTNGRAHIRSFQIALIFGDGADEIFNFVDQKTNGDRTMTTYNNFSTFGGPGPTFHDDLYCNPDWQGCASWTSHDPPGGYDRAGVGYAAFDGRRNPNCNGSRSVVLLVGTTRARRGIYNEGECGRINGLTDLAQAINMGELGPYGDRFGYWYYLDSGTANVSLNGNQMPVFHTPFWMNPNSKLAMLDMRSPLHAISMNAASAVVNQGDVVDVVIQYNGIELSRQVRLVQDLSRMAALHY